MGMDMHVYVGPMVKCIGLLSNKNMSQIFYEEFDESLIDLESYWKSDFDTWVLNKASKASNARFDKWEETHLLELSSNDVDEAVRIFRETFGKEIETLHECYDEARVCFGVMSYYM